MKGQKGLRKGLCANNYTGRKVRDLGKGPPEFAVDQGFMPNFGAYFNAKDFVMHFFPPKGRGTERGHPHYIRLKLHDLAQLFNSMDPSPFIEKDLDAGAEEFIVSWARSEERRVGKA